MNNHNFKTSLILKSGYNIILLILVLLVGGCASVKQIAIENDAERLLKQSEIFSSQFTGFSLFDLDQNEYAAAYNSTLKFTPASNTKLLTLYASLKSFRDSIPSLIYQKKDSGIVVMPLGDPSFLYEPFSQQPAIDFLGDYSSISIAWPDKELKSFGSGWAWDDYSFDFQTQRSWWPIYGNAVNVRITNDTLKVIPSFFEDYLEVLETTSSENPAERDLNFNVFKVYNQKDTSDFKQTIPFNYSRELLLRLLQDTLEAKVSLTEAGLFEGDTLFSQNTDSVLAKMLKPSDNFISEQLLLLAAGINGHEDIESFIEQIRVSWLVDLNDMVWVDGSGLSRYNLIAPVDQVRLLKKCVDEFGWDRMIALLPTGGEGTLEEWYVPDEGESPYIFAKTGTLSNNHNLSGYLITRSGKRMIFSFMNNHFTRPTDEVKNAMEEFLLKIRNAY